MWLRCVSGVRVRVTDPALYDARYFLIEPDDVGHTVCGWVDRCVLDAVEQLADIPNYLTDSKFIRSIKKQAGNRVVQGFLVERSVLAFRHSPSVLSNVLQNIIRRVKVVTFAGSFPEVDVLTKEGGVTLYTPDAFNYEAVDAVVRIIPPTHRKPATPQRPPSESGRKAQEHRDNGC